jgi:hypothetical protein
MLWLATTAVWAGDTIRSFELSDIVHLGERLYQQDKIASDATDFLFTARPDAKVLPLRGWITQYEGSIKRVYFLQGTDDQRPSLAYTLTMVDNGLAKIAEGHGDPLPEFVAKRYKARKAAIAAIPKFAPDRNYNYEVLDDPDEKGGFLVYALATSNDPDEVVIGGHYRVTVSENGTVKQVDALSKSFLALNKRTNITKGAKPGLSMSHLVSDTPVETHVYLSILHRTRLYVTIPGHDTWKVEEGIITQMEPALKLGPGADFDLGLSPGLKLEPKKQ